MCKQPDILESEKIHFAVMAIEAGAREMGISPMEMRRRLEKITIAKSKNSRPKNKMCH